MNWLEITTIIVSIASLLIAGAGFLFSKHKYDVLEKKIGELQLRKLQEDEAEKKKAYISANIVKHTKGTYILKIYNSGKSKAFNVNVELLGEHNAIQFMNWKEHFDMISPAKGYDAKFIILGDLPEDTVHLKFSWDDDFDKNQVNEELVTVS